MLTRTAKGRAEIWVYYDWLCIHNGIMLIKRVKASLTVKDQNLYSRKTKRWQIGSIVANGQADLEHLNY